LRFIYALWAVVIAIWITCAVISEDTGARWLYAVAAILTAVSGVLYWWERRKRAARRSDDIDQQRTLEL
jgi:Flp pilus assembly protein TadB